jgi:hypothetical protein
MYDDRANAASLGGRMDARAFAREDYINSRPAHERAALREADRRNALSLPGFALVAALGGAMIVIGWLLPVFGIAKLISFLVAT